MLPLYCFQEPTQPALISLVTGLLGLKLHFLHWKLHYNDIAINALKKSVSEIDDNLLCVAYGCHVRFFAHDTLRFSTRPLSFVSKAFGGIMPRLT
jgi:hypothetical protein